MNWIAIVWSGFVATTLAASFFWLVRSLGWTTFSPTIQLGCLLTGDPRLPLTETLGLALLFLLGSTVVPALYGVLFATLTGVSGLAGALLGLAHGLLAGALLPTLGMISACVRSGAIPPPGHFGIRWGWPTPFGVVFGHLLYGGVTGAVMAAFLRPTGEEVMVLIARL
jgi:hypothetical protein